MVCVAIAQLLISVSMQVLKYNFFDDGRAFRKKNTKPCNNNIKYASMGARGY